MNRITNGLVETYLNETHIYPSRWWLFPGASVSPKLDYIFRDFGPNLTILKTRFIFIILIIQITLVSCEPTCHYTNFLSVDVSNESSQPVSLTICSAAISSDSYGFPIPAGSVSAQVPAGAKSQNVQTVLSTGSHADDGDACGHYGNAYATPNYATLSSTDLTAADLCQRDPSNNTGTVSDDFIVVNKGSACPSGYLPFDQSKNPC